MTDPHLTDPLIPNPLWLTEQDVVSLMSLGQAIDALEAGLRFEAGGHARNMLKTHVAWDKSTLHAIGAVFDEAGYYGVKSWGHTPLGATPLFLLWDATSGRLCAVIEAFAMGQLRTGGISGLATRLMARADAQSLAIIGTGKQALPQVAAVAAVRPLRKLYIHARRPEGRLQLADKLRACGFDMDIIDCATVEAATMDADIVTTATRATEPLIHARHLKPGTHINAVGAITPERMEIAADVGPRIGLAVADDPVAVRKLSSEFSNWFGDANDAWRRLNPLSALVAGQDVNRQDVRHQNGDLSLFKAMGMGISDLSLAVRIYADARAKGLGRPLPHPERAAIRLRS